MKNEGEGDDRVILFLPCSSGQVASFMKLGLLKKKIRIEILSLYLNILNLNCL